MTKSTPINAQAMSLILGATITTALLLVSAW